MSLRAGKEQSTAAGSAMNFRTARMEWDVTCSSAISPAVYAVILKIVIPMVGDEFCKRICHDHFVEPNASAFPGDAMCDLMAWDNGGNCNIDPACATKDDPITFAATRAIHRGDRTLAIN